MSFHISIYVNNKQPLVLLNIKQEQMKVTFCCSHDTQSLHSLHQQQHQQRDVMMLLFSSSSFVVSPFIQSFFVCSLNRLRDYHHLQHTFLRVQCFRFYFFFFFFNSATSWRGENSYSKVLYDGSYVCHLKETSLWSGFWFIWELHAA